MHIIFIYSTIQIYEQKSVKYESPLRKNITITNITITILLITSCLFFQTQITCTSSLNKRADISNCDHKRNQSSFFYAPEIEDRGAYCFCPVCHSVILSFRHSVILQFCHSVILSSSLKLKSCLLLLNSEC